MLDVVKTDKMATLYSTLLLAMSLGHDLYRVVARYCFLPANIYSNSLGWLENTTRSMQPICCLYWNESKYIT